MYGFSLLILYVSVLSAIPLSKFIIQGPSGLDDIEHTKKVKVYKLAPLFTSWNIEYKEKKEMYLIEFLIQISAYVCTLISISLCVLSPIQYTKNQNDVWIWLNFIFGLLFIALFVIIEVSYSFIIDIFIPNFMEIPNRKRKETEEKITDIKKDVARFLDDCDLSGIKELLSKKNYRLLKRYKNTGVKTYFNKKSNKWSVYFNSELFQFSSNIVDHVKSIFQELNKKIIDWEYLRSIIINQNE